MNVVELIFIYNIYEEMVIFIKFYKKWTGGGEDITSTKIKNDFVKNEKYTFDISYSFYWSG